MFAYIAAAALATPAFALQDPVPTQDQQLAILANVSQFVASYLDTVPNLICLKTVEQYRGNKNGEKWHKLDTLSSRLTLVNGKEKATLERINNKPLTDLHRAWRSPLTTEGEFGVMLGLVLSKAADAKIDWNRWETMNGHHVAVFNYSIDNAHSTLKLSRSDLASAVVPFSGSLYADPESGVVWRVTEHVTDIPKEVEMLEMETTVDYGEVPIAGKSYMLPVHAIVIDHNPSDTNRNEITYSDYRKFEAESTITFGDGGTAPKQ